MENKQLKTQVATVVCGALVGEGTRSLFGYIESDIFGFSAAFNMELPFDFFGGVTLGFLLYELGKWAILFGLRRGFSLSAWLSYILTAAVVSIQNPNVLNEYRQLLASLLVSSFGVLLGFFGAYYTLND